MQEEQIAIDSYESLVDVVTSHGGGTLISLGQAENLAAPRWFICQVECHDGTLIEFYAEDGELASNLIEELYIDPDKLFHQFLTEFIENVSDPDPFVFTIKGLISLESLIISIIEASFLDPSSLDLDRTGFDKKVTICVSAGLIHDDVAPALRKLAKVRNSFAHQFRPSLTEKDEMDFVNVLRQSERMKGKLLEAEPEWSGIRAGIWVLYMYLFEQLLKVATNKEFLYDFWQNLVEVPEDTLVKRSISVHPKFPFDLELGNNDDT